MFCGLNNGVYTCIRQKGTPFVSDCRQCYCVYMHAFVHPIYYFHEGKIQAQKLLLPKLPIVVVQY